MSSSPMSPADAGPWTGRRRLAAVGAAAALLWSLCPSPALAGPVAAPEREGHVMTRPEALLPMGFGKQSSRSSTLKRYLRWADAYGFRVSEHPSYGGVTRGAHASRSWHYDGLAADLNWGPPGAPASERTNVRFAIKVADSLGLGVIYARDGTVGSAADHRSHLHVDVGSTSNYGRGLVRVPEGQRRTQSLQGAAHFPWAQRDNLWGTNTDKRLQAIRAASRMHGTKFPYGVKLAQRAVGVTADGKWGPKSRAAHDRTVAAVQRAISVSPTGVWGPVTERTYLKVRSKLR
ncbi:hypothetical protein ABE437_12000 [Isoptericola cucumis]|uniref:hypothetical protein n=1 Tax=Isoptericola cucumis TaxID=1776856 RepID=UPI003209A7C2